MCSVATGTQLLAIKPQAVPPPQLSRLSKPLSLFLSLISVWTQARFYSNSTGNSDSLHARWFISGRDGKRWLHCNQHDCFPSSVNFLSVKRFFFKLSSYNVTTNIHLCYMHVNIQTFFFFWLPHSIWSSQADPSHSCDLSWSYSNAGSLNPLSWAGDPTCIPALPRHHWFRCATAGIPQTSLFLTLQGKLS